MRWRGWAGSFNLIKWQVLGIGEELSNAEGQSKAWRRIVSKRPGGNSNSDLMMEVAPI
jgi:hypothetical protein